MAEKKRTRSEAAKLGHERQRKAAATLREGEKLPYAHKYSFKRSYTAKLNPKTGRYNRPIGPVVPPEMRKRGPRKKKAASAPKSPARRVVRNLMHIEFTPAKKRRAHK